MVSELTEKIHSSVMKYSLFEYLLNANAFVLPFTVTGAS
jgi:hypothetical protein